MKFLFPEKNPKKVLDSLQREISSRSLNVKVSFELNGNDLNVVLSKLGKSTLNFCYEDEDEGMSWTLSSEKIAFSHKAFRRDVVEALKGIVEEVDGWVA